MSAHLTRRTLLLSSAALAGALAGYGRSAYGACVTGVPPNVVCSGANVVQQDIMLDDATVTTEAGFSVDTPNPTAVFIIGDGAISYTDDLNNSPLTAATNGLYIRSDGPITGGNQGSITVNTGGTLMGGEFGIIAKNYGYEETNITATGEVTGTTKSGISVLNEQGTDVTVTTGAGTVTGGDFGIDIVNNGSGDTTVTANGDVMGTSSTSYGIYVFNYNTAGGATVTATGAVTGGYGGIMITNEGSGAVTIETYGEVTGTSYYGIYVLNQSGTDVTVTSDASVTGGEHGINVKNLGMGTGTGTVDITANNDVTGTSYTGIYALNVGSGDLNITTTTGANVTSNGTGIAAENSVGGAVNIQTGGDVSGGPSGIETTSFAGTNLSVTTAAGTSVSGDRGIYARNYGTGYLAVTANSEVTGNNGDGIYARNFGGGAVNIEIAGSVTSNGADAADFAVDSGGGATSLTVAGTINGGTGGAVQFDNSKALDDRLELQSTGSISGAVFAGPGTDTLAFAGTGDGTFDLSDIDTGGGTRQYISFEQFQVESGVWRFSGTTTEAFTVEGGTLGGTGAFGGLTVGDGATFAPGNSIGTITVNGAFVLEPGAIYEVEIDPSGNSDQVLVNGTVNLTGSVLDVIAESGNYRPRTQYTIIENDGNDAVTGEFAEVNSNLAFLNPSVDYEGGDGNDVVLILTRNSTLFSDVAGTPNHRGVAGALDTFPTDDPLFLAVLNQSEAGARQAFDALSGEIHASVAGILADDSRYTREAVLGRLMQASHSDALGANGPQVATLYNGKSLQPIAPERAPLAFWTQGFGAWGDYDGDGNAASVDRDLGGFLSGVDASVGGTWRAGFATGASFSSIEKAGRASAADIDTYHLGAYVGGEAGGFAVRGGGLYAWHDIDTSRAVVFPGFFERQSASYDADTGQIFGEIAYPMQSGTIALEPFGGIAFVSVDSDNFRERGGPSASLRGTDLDQDVGFTTLGLRAATTMQWGATTVTPHIAAAWQHAFDDVTPGASLAFAATGIGFDVAGVPLAEDAALIDAGLDFAIGENGTAGISYSGQFGDGVTDNAVKGRATLLF